MATAVAQPGRRRMMIELMGFRDGTAADVRETASWIATPRDCELWAGAGLAWPLDLAALPAQLGMDTAHSLALVERGELVAFGQWLARDAGRAHLTRVIVRPGARRRGHGAALVAELTRRARATGCSRASLNVNEDNPGAIALYERLGFRHAERPAGDPPSPACRYLELALTPATPDEVEDNLRRVTIGPIERPAIVVLDYDPDWPARFASHQATICAALGTRAVRVEHIGSTSVPGLAAKPVVDVLLVVEDSADEASYLPDLEAAGYELRIREPDFHEHRMLRTPQRDVHLHVLSAGSPEIQRYLLLRDRLRADAADRALYELTKRELAQRSWPTMQHYAEAKGAVIEEIMARARGE